MLLRFIILLSLTSPFFLYAQNIDLYITLLEKGKINDVREKPMCIILDTIKGKGVSFMEDPSWHCKVPTDEEYELAMKELGF